MSAGLITNQQCDTMVKKDAKELNQNWTIRESVHIEYDIQQASM
jgi:hypothetical protein